MVSSAPFQRLNEAVPPIDYIGSSYAMLRLTPHSSSIFTQGPLRHTCFIQCNVIHFLIHSRVLMSNQNACNIGIPHSQSVLNPHHPHLIPAARTASSHHTANRPIDRLPAELLAVIFETLADSLFQDPLWDISNEFPTHATPSVSVYSWVRVTQVCKPWRAIALDCASLWTRILVGTLKSERAMALHSQQSLLTVRADCTAIIPRLDHRSQVPPILNDVARRIARVRTLELKVDKTSVRGMFRLFSSVTQTPSLHSLRFDSDDTYNQQMPCSGWSMPNLKSLDIRAPLADIWRPFMRRSLRHLSLESFTSKSTTAVLNGTAESLPLLDILAELPLLRSLVLRLDAYTGSLESRSIVRTALPELRLLEVSGHLGHCVTILDHLTIPNDATIILNSSKNCYRRGTHYFGPNASHCVIVLDDLLSSGCSALGAREPTAISLAVEENRFLRLRGWLSGSKHNFDNADFKPIIDITLPCRESDADIRRILSICSFRRVRCLQLGPMSDLLGPFGAPYTVIVWFNILSRLRDITQLRLRSLEDPVFWIGLLLPHDSTMTTLRFPLLTDLELVDVVFRRPTPGTGLDNHRFSSTALRSKMTLADITGQPVDFLRCLVARRKVGGSLHKVVIREAHNFHDHDALYMGAIEVANSIDWDGREAVLEGKTSCSVVDYSHS